MEGQRKFWWGCLAIVGITLMGLFTTLDPATALGGVLGIFGAGSIANGIERKMNGNKQ